MIAKVLVDVPVKAVDKLFDYAIPPELAGFIEPGMRVKVPFGPRTLQGYCLELAESSPLPDLKPIIAVLDLENYLTPELIALARMIHEDTATVFVKVIETILPSALRAKYRTKIMINDQDRLDDSLKQLFARHQQLYLDEVTVHLSQLRRAINEGILRQETEIRSKASIRTRRMVRLVNPDAKKPTPKQALLLEILADKGGTLDALELIRKAEVTMAVVDTMVKNGFVEIVHQETYRELFSLADPTERHVTLNEAQKEAYARIVASLGHDQTFLLHGVTGSGKTEIYLKAIEAVVDSGKEALVLVPEIALTPMMVSRFKSRFKDRLAVLHSGLSAGEKYDEWRKIIRGEAKIVIGARSACFAPFSNLGIIIVDEFHETTYKQDDQPKYHAIDVLFARSKTHGCPVVLGSATPSIDAYARYKRGHYELLELPKRALNAALPTLEVVDMKQEFKAGNPSVFSRRLVEELRKTLAAGMQAILLMNRRGYSTFLICRNCGHVYICPDCDISLTYHEADRSLKCHYCNHKEALPKTCAKCGSEELRYFGTGTQKIEAELKILFPQARLVRMDTDTTQAKNAHEILLDRFANEADILLGTQMIAKGLDFPRGTLVGIIQADGNLYSPDFRAPEKTFQLITQVAGRAGRRDMAGRVIVQAFNPQHYAIKYAVEQDYLGFYGHEMQLRKLARYSPFYFIAQILFIGEKMRDLFLAAKEAVESLRRSLSDEAIVLGPSLPLISRIKGNNQCQVIIKYREEPQLNPLLKEIRDRFDSELIRVMIDKNPTLG